MNKIEVLEKSNKATVLLQLLKDVIGIDTELEKTTWQEISKKFGELMEEANKELVKNAPKVKKDVRTKTNTLGRSKKVTGKTKTIN